MFVVAGLGGGVLICFMRRVVMGVRHEVQISEIRVRVDGILAV